MRCRLSLNNNDCCIAAAYSDSYFTTFLRFLQWTKMLNNTQILLIAYTNVYYENALNQLEQRKMREKLFSMQNKNEEEKKIRKIESKEFMWEICMKRSLKSQCHPVNFIFFHSNNFDFFLPWKITFFMIFFHFFRKKTFHPLAI